MIRDFQIDQRYLICKVSLRAPHETVYGHKKVCLEQNFSIGNKTHAVAMSAVKKERILPKP